MGGGQAARGALTCAGSRMTAVRQSPIRSVQSVTVHGEGGELGAGPHRDGECGGSDDGDGDGVLGG